ncbi:MAG: prenyltransferase/squalene oxidase repeat-containing protein, partial [Thermoplasmatota archaeon]
MDDIYYFVSIMNLTGEQIDPVLRTKIISRIQSYQNADGGFGDWYNDRSKAGSTMRAINVLRLLGSGPVNRTGASTFLNRLQVSGLIYGNFGFRSSLKESDADISSTYDAVQGLLHMGSQLPNRTGIEFYVKDHQNFDGGFGYQTNRESGIFWDSTVLHTQRGLLSAKLLDIEPEFMEEAYDFILINQESTGGFSNTPGTGARVSYTYNAITSLRSMDRTIPRTDDIASFILSNQIQDGGFIEYSLDTKAGL